MKCENWDDGDFYYISFSVSKSRRYHAKMRAFYKACHDLTMAATAVTGSSAFVLLISNANITFLAQILTAVVALSATLDLVFSFSKKSRIHDDLCRRFTLLSAQMVGWEPNDRNYKRACAERLRIEADEPTERRLVDLLSNNEEARSRGCQEEDLVPLTWLQRKIGYIFTFGLENIENWKHDQERNAS